MLHYFRCIFLLLTVTTASVFPQLQFAAKKDLPTGEGPISIALGDFNGDGKLDIVCANYKSNTISLLLNATPPDGSAPSFLPKIDLHTEEKPMAVAVGDFNGDGKPDFVVANYLSNNISIFLNTSRQDSASPSFAVKEDVPTEERPISLFVADFNGDGRPDLAVANYKSNSISVFLNTTSRGSSSVSFAQRIDLPAGTRPVFVTAGDLNGDGRPDIVAANYRSNSISIFFNETPANGTAPVFSRGTEVQAGERPMTVAIGDVNGDEKNDILVADQGSNSISVLMNAAERGAATPLFLVKTELITGANPQAVCFIDAVGKGKSDVAAGNYNSGTISIFINTTVHGSTVPAFSLKKDIPSGVGPSFLAVGNLSGSGLNDLAVANYGSNSISVFFISNASGRQPPK
ncbi:MAG TPA: VCBS repeat-containing protein [Bacteroidota bacterium]|nr:VCBS repeat-containing protein [Bacteroidota bacterium]